MESKRRMHKTNRIHFVGIGGAGMGGIAEILLREGYEITGSDRTENEMTRRLSELGITIYSSQQASHVVGVDVVVVSSAIPKDNPEVVAAMQSRIPIVPRAQMLAELMRFRFGIAIAGTHGKTTTTSLTASVLAEGGLDPTFVIGGKLNSAGSNAYLGKSKYLVAEADESDASFLHLMPMIAIVTNIDQDHMGTYGGDFNRLRKTFLEFLHNLPFYGLAVLCIDDPTINALRAELPRAALTYGFHPEADVRLLDYQQHGMQSQFSIRFPDGRELRDLRLNLAGRHNALNATAALAVAYELNIPEQAIFSSLAAFQGIGRRMQVYGEYQIHDKTVLLVDDYGHHPREVAVTYEALSQAWPERRVIVVFQPHRYTRTRDLYEDFVAVLSQADQLVLLEVYSAGETLINGADSRSLCRSIRQRGLREPVLVADNAELLPVLHNLIQDGDVILMQGAGNIGALSEKLAKLKMQLPRETTTGASSL